MHYLKQIHMLERIFMICRYGEGWLFIFDTISFSIYNVLNSMNSSFCEGFGFFYSFTSSSRKGHDNLECCDLSVKIEVTWTKTFTHSYYSDLYIVTCHENVLWMSLMQVSCTWHLVTISFLS
jgi:hypothetical protein